MTDQPTGRALAEAAARAMGWTERMIEKIDLPNDREMEAWLRMRGTVVGVGCPLVGFIPRVELTDRRPPADCLRETSLARLVVAVAEREATNG